MFDSLVTTAVQSAAPSSSAGLAWMHIGKTGSVHYRIKLRGLTSKVTRVKIESTGSSKANKKLRVVEDVTDMLSVVDSKEPGGVSWINGTVSRLAAKDLELLYEGELLEQFSVSEIRVKLVPRLNPVGNATGTNRAALGWVHVEKECNFHYEVAVTSSLAARPGTNCPTA